MTIEIKLSSLMWGLLTLPIFPIWLVWYWEKRNNELLLALSVLLTIALAIAWAVSPIPLSGIVEAETQIQTDRGTTIQDVTMHHRSLIPFLPWGWDYTQEYRRVTRENGEHIWINLETKHTAAHSNWDEDLRDFNAENVDPATVDVYINE